MPPREGGDEFSQAWKQTVELKVKKMSESRITLNEVMAHLALMMIFMVRLNFCKYIPMRPGSLPEAYRETF